MISQKQYEANELARFRRDLERVEGAPLVDRQAARDEYAAATPEDLKRATSHLLGGDYGFGPYHAAQTQVLGHKRRNQVAQLALWVAAIEYGCPATFARGAFRKWSPAKQAAVTAAIESELTAAERQK